MDLRDVYPPQEARRMDALATVLRETFPDMSVAHSRIQAEVIAAARDETPHMHHRGSDDREQLRRLRAGLREVGAAIEELSPWAASALSGALFSMRGHIPDRDIPGELAEPLRLAAEAARLAEERLAEGKPEGKTNWQAAAVVGAARECWAAVGGAEAPSAGLNEATPFAHFLEDIFAALKIEATARGAFNAWHKEVHSRA